MPRHHHPKQSNMRQRIACAAARLMAEDGIEDVGHAKRKAARQLGAPGTEFLPADDEVEAELRAYRALYQGEEHRDRMQQLTDKALAAMRWLAEFRPYLTGAVLKGTAGPFASIDIEIHPDSDKAVELFMLRQQVAYRSDLERIGAELSVPVLRLEKDGIPVNLWLLPPHGERMVRRSAHTGRSHERMSLDALESRVAQAELGG